MIAGPSHRNHNSSFMNGNANGNINGNYSFIQNNNNSNNNGFISP